MLNPPINNFKRQKGGALRITLLTRFNYRHVPLLGNRCLREFTRGHIMLMKRSIRTTIPICCHCFTRFAITRTISILLYRFHSTSMSKGGDVFDIHMVRLPHVRIPQRRREALKHFRRTTRITMRFRVLRVHVNGFLVRGSLIRGPNVTFRVSFMSISALFRPRFAFTSVISCVIVMFRFIRPHLFMVLRLLRVIRLFRPTRAMPRTIGYIPQRFIGKSTTNFRLTLRLSIEARFMIMVRLCIITKNVFPMPFGHVFRTFRHAPKGSMGIGHKIIIVFLRVLMRIRQGILIRSGGRTFVLQYQIRHASAPIEILKGSLYLIFLLIVRRASAQFIRYIISKLFIDSRQLSLFFYRGLGFGLFYRAIYTTGM